MLCACFNPDSPGDLPASEASSAGPSVTSSVDPDTDAPTGTSPETSPPPDTSTGDPSSAGVTGTPSTGDAASETDDTSSIEDTTGGPTSCGGSATPDNFCIDQDPEHPYCEPNSGLCVACLDDLDCPVSQVCDPDGFACVGCVDDDDCTDPDAPACDPETLACGCYEHSDCPQTACDLANKTCFPAAQTAVVWSSSAVGPLCRVDNQCTETDPCCNLTAAYTQAVMSDKEYIVIRVLPGTAGVHDTLTVDDLAADKHVAILGWPEATLESNTGGAPLIFVDALAHVYVARLTLKALAPSTAGAGFSCVAGLSAWIDDVTVEPLTTGVGLYANACELQARRSLIRGAKRGLWLAGGADAKIFNTIVAHPIEYAVRSEKDADVELVFSTVVESTGVPGSLLQCEDLGSTIVARNSLLFAVPDNGSSACPGSLATNSLVTYDPLVGPGTTSLTSAAAENLFIAFDAGDLHVKPGAPLVSSTAIREAGDPWTDIDGDPRPLAVGAMDWAGADVP
ncbi:MAG: hypothetical protein JNL82_09510 [Myxococcales bacterium]|nr:hypothetical protein [Myxococcales bacterium]